MTDIRITDLSDGAITTVDNQYVWNGTGVFDVLMKAINGNIKVQYDNGNIDTSQYATVYLGAIQTAIQSAVDFLLREKLTEAQVDDVLKGTLLKQEQIDASKADTTRNDNESVVKIATMNEQIRASQIEMSIKLDQAGKDLLIKQEQINELVKKQELMQEQINASQIEVSLKIDQTAKELQVKDKELEVKDEQIASSQAETIIKQDGSAADIKLKAAQTDKLAADIDNVDAQRALYDRQRQGFDDNKYQKLLDTQTNAWALMFSSGMLEASQLPVAISGAQLTNVYELASGTTIPEGAVGDSTGTATTAG